jgi:hypothetical protein
MNGHWRDGRSPIGEAEEDIQMPGHLLAEAARRGAPLLSTCLDIFWHLQPQTGTVIISIQCGIMVTALTGLSQKE